jgi:predicted ATP-dependent endonuclease of OLD family
MGAGAAVFNAAQAILVTEGVTDLALLPRLLAEALERPTLGVPTLPGFSEVNDPLVFERQGAQVAYVFDGDRQGLRYQRKVWTALARAKGGRTVDDLRPEDRDRVLTLEAGCDLEDYLHPDYYVQAINTYLSTHRLTDDRLTAADLPEHDRPAFLKRWAAEHGLGANHLDKRSVAEALLDVWWEHQQHIDPNRQAGLQAVAQQVVAALF